MQADDNIGSGRRNPDLTWEPETLRRAKMNNFKSERSRILAKKLACGQPLSAADYRHIRSLIEQILGPDELRKIGTDGEKRSASRISGTASVGEPSRRHSAGVKAHQD